MKITDVSVVVHERHLPPGMPLPPMEMAVLRIHTDEGLEGSSAASGSSYQYAIHPPGEYDTAHFSYGLTEPIAIDPHGIALAPTRPGLGYDIDWELINASRVAELR